MIKKAKQQKYIDLVDEITFDKGKRAELRTSLENYPELTIEALEKGVEDYKIDIHNKSINSFYVDIILYDVKMKLIKDIAQSIVERTPDTVGLVLSEMHDSYLDRKLISDDLGKETETFDEYLRVNFKSLGAVVYDTVADEIDIAELTKRLN